MEELYDPEQKINLKEIPVPEGARPDPGIQNPGSAVPRLKWSNLARGRINISVPLSSDSRGPDNPFYKSEKMWAISKSEEFTCIVIG